MSAQTVITCDSCGAREIARNGMSPTNVRRWVTEPKGWKSKRSRKFSLISLKGTQYEQLKEFTEALDFCPQCVENNRVRAITTPII